MKKVKTLNKRPALIGIVVYCNNCEFGSDIGYTDNYIQKAKKHVNQTGHDVTVETTYYQTYRKETD